MLTRQNPASITCDVCIIGGNLAGSYLAFLLAHEGIEVIVVEEHKRVGEPLQCAGIVSQKLSDLIQINDEIILNRINTARLISPDGSFIDIFGRERPYVIDRVKLDKYYYTRAVKTGARFFLGEKFITLKKDSGKKGPVVIQTNNREIMCKIIVGCDGPNSKVALLHGVRHNLIFGMQVRAKYDILKNSTHMLFNPKWKELFGWIIPEGNGICRIGLGCKNNSKINFRELLDDLGINSNKIIERNGGFIPFGYVKSIAFERAILLGDSACMVKATTGGGIIMLLSASKIAKSAILKAMKKNDFSRKFLVRNYEKHKKMRYLKIQLRIHFMIRTILSRFKTEDFNVLFNLILQDLSIIKIIKNEADMDFPLRLIIKLLRNKRFDKFLFKFVLKNLNLIRDLFKTIVNI